MIHGCSEVLTLPLANTRERNLYWRTIVLPSFTESKLPALRFRMCAKNAWDATLKLVSWACGEKEVVVEAMYRKWCKSHPADDAVVWEDSYVDSSC